MSKFYFKNVIAVAICLFVNATLFAQTPDVYVGGIKDYKATIWKNEVPQEIANGNEVNSVVVVGEDVYAAGRNTELVPVVWKNGEVLYTFSEPTFEDRSVTSMKIHGNDLYVTTIDLTPSYMLVGRLWINGVLSEDYADAAELYSVEFDGEDIYVAGRTNEEGVIWKNGEPIYTYSSNVTALFVDVKVVDGDVYYMGGDFGGAGKCAAIKSQNDINANSESNKALSINIWKNDEVLYTLASEVLGGKLAVANGKVCAAGQAPSGNAYKAFVWINGEATIISNEWSGAASIALNNDDVYVTGFMGNYPDLNAFIWKNGELSSLTSESYNYGYCILVVDENTGIEETKDLCNIYPNPANDYISIEGIEFEEATLYNSIGQLVFTTKNSKIDVSSLESGLYLLKLDTKSKNNVTRSILIQH